MNKIKNILKCINIFSFGNKTYQNINSEDSKMLLNFSLNNCGELWNDLKFKKAIDSLKHLKSIFYYMKQGSITVLKIMKKGIKYFYI